MQKRAQEVARYVLPLATPAHLYHTVNGLTLLRYYVLASQPDVPAEVRSIVERMVDEVLAVDPYFLGAPGFPLDLRPLARGGDARSADVRALARDGRATRGAMPSASAPISMPSSAVADSRLVAWNPDGEQVLADAVRTVLGAAEMPDDDALAPVLSGADNPYLGHPSSSA